MGSIQLTLQGSGSKYSYGANGAVSTPYPENYTPPTNTLATKASNLHFDEKKDLGGYSTRGTEIANYPEFYQNYLSYDVGNNIPDYIPAPSTLEIGDPVGADAYNKPKYTPTPGNRYQDQNFK